MKVYSYKNYKEYTAAQKRAYHKKYKNVWAREKNIEAISQYLKKRDPKRGLCHGVRQGHEIIWFNKYLPACNVIGTDIGGSDEEIGILQHDFNNSDSDLLNRFDFIYSNSFDHAYSPADTFIVWANQVVSGGVIVLEYDRRQEHTGEVSMSANSTDPVSVRFEELISLVPMWCEKARVIDVLKMPVVTVEWRKALVIEVNNE